MTLHLSSDRRSARPLQTFLLVLAACAGAPLAFQATGARAAEPLPDYKPEQSVSGTIRSFGSDFVGTRKFWEAGFVKYQPGIHFSHDNTGSGGALPGLMSGAADLGMGGREPVTMEFLAYDASIHHDPCQITVATGAYDLKNYSWAPVIFVNKVNPIERLTMKQLDGIFGSERTGGLKGMRWMPQYARGEEENIRTWDQLGLTGDWAGKEIQTYGYAMTGMTNFFEMVVLHGGDKWNPNMKEYVEDGNRMISEGKIGETGGMNYGLTEGLAKDKYGMAWTGIPHASKVPQVKPLAIASGDGPYVFPTRETITDRTYPLTRSVFAFINHAPGESIDPKVKEYLHYILSRQGQEDVAKGKIYIPLPAATIRQELEKLN